jgi:hypothetical protein
MQQFKHYSRLNGRIAGMTASLSRKQQQQRTDMLAVRPVECLNSRTDCLDVAVKRPVEFLLKLFENLRHRTFYLYSVCHILSFRDAKVRKNDENP